MYQRGGEHSKVAKKLTEDLLLNLQAREGSWQGTGQEGGAGKVYSTAMAVLVCSQIPLPSHLPKIKKDWYKLE